MKAIDFIRGHSYVLILVNIPILMFLVNLFNFDSEILEVIFIFTTSFMLMMFEKFVLNALSPKVKPKSIEELIDESWLQYKKEKQEKRNG